MINGHPSDDAIQLYSSGQQVPAQVTLHIESCEACLAAVSQYRLLTGALEDLPSESFSFDLETMVMQHIPAAVAPARALARQARVTAGWIILALVCIAVPGALVYRYRVLLSGLVEAAEPLMIPLIAITALTFMGLLGVDMLRQYQRKSAMLENGNLPATY